MTNNVHKLALPTNAPEDLREDNSHLSFHGFLLDRLPLVKSQSDGCDGLFVEITDGDVKRLFDLESPRVRQEVNNLYEEFHKYSNTTFLSESKCDEAISYLKAKSHKMADNRSVYKRTSYSKDDNTIYVDLSNTTGDVVKVTATGWEVIRPQRPIFITHNEQRPMPVPKPSSSGYESFVKMLSLDLSPENVKLLTGVALGFLIPSNFAESFCYPVVVLRGDPGSGKSTLCNKIKSLVDNEICNILSKPTKLDDLYVLGQTSHLLCFDNLDGIKGDMSDAICQVTTNSAMSKRALYTNNGRITLKVHCPFLLNGIGDVLYRQDIVDRSVTIFLKRIEEYQPDFDAASEILKSEALGYLLDLMSKSLKNYALKKVTNLPRLATLAKFVDAAEPFGCKTTFISLLKENQTETLSNMEENHIFTSALVEFMANHKSWSGTYKKLLMEISPYASDEDEKSDEWIKTPRKLSSFFSFRKLNLTALGIDIIQGAKKNNGRIISLKTNKNFSYISKQKPEPYTGEDLDPNM